MLQCEECGKFLGVRIRENAYEARCTVNGDFRIGTAYADAFSCPSFEEKEEGPPGENVMIVLKGSGRDILVYDADIKSCGGIMERLLSGPQEGLVEGVHMYRFGDAWFEAGEIAAVSYIGG